MCLLLFVNIPDISHDILYLQAAVLICMALASLSSLETVCALSEWESPCGQLVIEGGQLATRAGSSVCVVIKSCQLLEFIINYSESRNLISFLLSSWNRLPAVALGYPLRTSPKHGGENRSNELMLTGWGQQGCLFLP